MVKPHASNPRAVRERRDRHARIARVERQAERLSGVSTVKEGDAVYAVAAVAVPDLVEAERRKPDLAMRLQSQFPNRLAPIRWDVYFGAQARVMASRFGPEERADLEEKLEQNWLLFSAALLVPEVDTASVS
jgi:hypothetical protein